MLRHLTRASAALAAATAIVVATQTPANAQTLVGEADNFYATCDATVYISDSLVGSPGTIEAWGGWSCPNPQKWGGVLRIELYRNGSKIAEQSKNYGMESTGHAEVAAANNSGTQSWKAKLHFSPTIFPGKIVETGTLRS